MLLSMLTTVLLEVKSMSHSDPTTTVHTSLPTLVPEALTNLSGSENIIAALLSKRELPGNQSELDADQNA